MTDAVKQTGAENIHWNLEDLYPSISSAELQQDKDWLVGQADAFAETYRGRVASLGTEQLLEAMEQYEELCEIELKIGNFAQLNWVTQTSDPDAGRFMAQTRQFMAEIDQKLMFFELEWREVPEEIAKQAEAPSLSRYGHYLHVSREAAPYTLSEPEERVISELSLSGSQGWQRYFSEVMSRARFELDGEELNQSEILKHMFSPDRELRKRAADAMTAGLNKIEHTTTFIFNMLGLHKASQDKMRNYPTWVSDRNLSNQVDDASVENLIKSVTSRYDIVERYYNLMKKLWGFEEVFDYDRYAPLLNESSEYTWEQAREIVLDAYAAFDQRMADIAAEFFEKGWIDAAVEPNKQGGAFSASVVPSAHPYIMMNYVGNESSVMTLAHELGHGIHQYVAREQGLLQSRTPLTTAEMASTFGEMLVFDALMAQIDDPKVRLSMRLNKIADTFGTVFRQIAMNRFEDGMHTAIRAEGQLTTEQLSKIWLDTQQDMYGNSVTMREDYGLWWSYIPHFLQVPGYVYAYSYGELLVWALYNKYRTENESDFADRYLEVLTKGGSIYPDQLLSIMNVDLNDPAFWAGGLQLIDDMVALAEEEAEAIEW